jgi:hypothetical protein
MEGELHSTNDETSSNDDQNVLGKRKERAQEEKFIITKRQKTD